MNHFMETEALTWLVGPLLQPLSCWHNLVKSNIICIVPSPSFVIMTLTVVLLLSLWLIWDHLWLLSLHGKKHTERWSISYLEKIPSLQTPALEIKQIQGAGYYSPSANPVTIVPVWPQEQELPDQCVQERGNLGAQENGWRWKFQQTPL